MYQPLSIVPLIKTTASFSLLSSFLTATLHFTGLKICACVPKAKSIMNTNIALIFFIKHFLQVQPIIFDVFIGERCNLYLHKSTTLYIYNHRCVVKKYNENLADV